jgi:NAD(P)-dependent dehydrogenase (short-subunit alcohol dehydrogenase family)
VDLLLADKAVLVTGGSRGLGRELALAFAKEGCSVAICARSKDGLKRTISDIHGLGTKAFGVNADLAFEKDCQLVIDQTFAAFGRLDILVNNASVAVDTSARFEDQTDADVMPRVNGKALAAIRCTRSALPHLRASGDGRVILIGGTSVRSTFRGSEVGPGESNLITNGLGNAMLANFAKLLSDSVAKDGIMVNIVHPHVLRTDRHPPRMAARAAFLRASEEAAEADLASHIPIGRIIEPHDVVPLVLLLASPLAGAITGQAIAVDGGASRSIMY